MKKRKSPKFTRPPLPYNWPNSQQEVLDRISQAGVWDAKISGITPRHLSLAIWSIVRHRSMDGQRYQNHLWVLRKKWKPIHRRISLAIADLKDPIVPVLAFTARARGKEEEAKAYEGTLLMLRQMRRFLFAVRDINVLPRDKTRADTVVLRRLTTLDGLPSSPPSTTAIIPEEALRRICSIVAFGATTGLHPSYWSRLRKKERSRIQKIHARLQFDPTRVDKLKSALTPPAPRQELS